MGSGIPFVPPEASTVAGQVDFLSLLLLILTLGISTAVFVVIIVFLVAYRRRSPLAGGAPIAGSTPLELAWIAILVVLGIAAFGWGAVLFLNMNRPPSNTVPVYVVAKQWMWKSQYVGGQEEINQMHIPVGQPIRVTMISQDVIHDFSAPDFRVKADVLPGRYTTLWFEADQAGTYRLYCQQYCGLNHSQMIGSIVAMQPRDYETWLSSGAFLSPAGKGSQLFLQLGCVTCHRSDSLRRAPVLEGLYGQPVMLSNGQTVIADDDYIRESVLNPNAKIVAGYQPIMPSFEGRVSETQMVDLIAYIKSIGNEHPGGVPPVSGPQNTILTPTSGS